MVLHDVVLCDACDALAVLLTGEIKGVLAHALRTGDGDELEALCNFGCLTVLDTSV